MVEDCKKKNFIVIKKDVSRETSFFMTELDYYSIILFIFECLLKPNECILVGVSHIYRYVNSLLILYNGRFF